MPITTEYTDYKLVCDMCARALHTVVSMRSMDESCVEYICLFVFVYDFVLFFENMRKSNEGEWYKSGINGKTVIEN